MKKRTLLIVGFVSVAMMAMAQESLSYYLPKTELRFQLLVEKTSYTPGEFARYSERFLRKSAAEEPSTTYRLVGINMYTTAVADTAKYFEVPLDKKHTIFTVEKSPAGVLEAINAKAKTVSEPQAFTSAPRGKTPNPHDYMSEEILSAGSTAKMAELTAGEIYDIRSSRNDLNRGEAEYMPKDGDQLRFMLSNLDKQEEVLTQTFQGVTVEDTTQCEVVYVPMPEEEGKEKAEKTLLFRFSKHLGLVDNDDMAGVPYYIKVEDLKSVPQLRTAADGEKRSKDDVGVMVNMPGKIKITIYEGTRTLASFEAYVAQYGKLESLSSTLFSKKTTSHVVLNPVTGQVESIETEPLN